MYYPQRKSSKRKRSKRSSSKRRVVHHKGGETRRSNICINLDKVIAFRNESVFQCRIPNSFTRFSKDSASPSITYKFDFIPNTKYKSQPLEHAFAKAFPYASSAKNLTAIFDPSIDPDDQKQINVEGIQSLKVSLLGLEYEYLVYSIYINRIHDLRVNPHFVRSLGGIYRTKTKELVNLFQNWDRTVATLHDEYYNPYKYVDNTDDNDYRVIITQYRGTDVKVLEDYYDKPGVSALDKLALLFQVLTACYSMQHNGMVHNDLHSGNVLVSQSPVRHKYKYTENGQQYELYYTNNRICEIYDFDRSSVPFKLYHSKGNPLLQQDESTSNSSQFDVFDSMHPFVKERQRDMVKSIGYFFRNVHNISYDNKVLKQPSSQDIQIISRLIQCIIPAGKIFDIPIPDEQISRKRTRVKSNIALSTAVPMMSVPATSVLADVYRNGTFLDYKHNQSPIDDKLYSVMNTPGEILNNVYKLLSELDKTNRYIPTPTLNAGYVGFDTYNIDTILFNKQSDVTMFVPSSNVINIPDTISVNESPKTKTRI